MSEWQPIETAPKDGTWILAIKDDFVPGVVQFRNGFFRESEDEEGDIDWGLTHWMQLPPPPARSNPNEGGGEK